MTVEISLLFFLGFAAVVFAVGVASKFHSVGSVPERWPLVCPLCGFEHTENRRACVDRFKNARPNAQCASCKSDITATFLADPNVKKIRQAISDEDAKNASAKLRLQAERESEEEIREAVRPQAVKVPDAKA